MEANVLRTTTNLATAPELIKYQSMKTFQYKLGDKVLSIRLDEKQGTIADFFVDGWHHQPAEEEMPAYAAAIALALIEHEVEIVHDDEPGIITVEHHSTGWNNPSNLMNSLI